MEPQENPKGREKEPPSDTIAVFQKSKRSKDGRGESESEKI